MLVMTMTATLSLALVAYRRRFIATLTTLARLTAPPAETLSLTLGTVSTLPSQAHRLGVRFPTDATLTVPGGSTRMLGIGPPRLGCRFTESCHSGSADQQRSNHQRADDQCFLLHDLNSLNLDVTKCIGRQHPSVALASLADRCCTASRTAPLLWQFPCQEGSRFERGLQIRRDAHVICKGKNCGRIFVTAEPLNKAHSAESTFLYP
jgi:hypothetical protein